MDRLEFMRTQLAQLSIPWTRVEAIDGDDAMPEQIAPYAVLSGHRIRMEYGSQCAVATVIRLFQTILEEGHEAALILEDDVTLAPDIGAFLETTDWLPQGIGLVQFEKYGRRSSTRLAMPGHPTPARGRRLHRMVSRTGGAACYLITRRAIQTILKDFAPISVPLDHYLFSPNLGPHFHRLGVALVAPALARQMTPVLTSDINWGREVQPKTLRERLWRGYYEINRVPHQLWALMRGAKLIRFEFKMDAGGDDASGSH
jgi:glycosyl transferase family 25